jgi:hypothetical protein
MTMMDKKKRREREGTRGWRSGQLIMISPESERVRDQTAQEDRTREETLLRSTEGRRAERWRHTHAHMRAQTFNPSLRSTTHCHHHHHHFLLLHLHTSNVETHTHLRAHAKARSAAATRRARVRPNPLARDEN